MAAAASRVQPCSRKMAAVVAPPSESRQATGRVLAGLCRWFRPIVPRGRRVIGPRVAGPFPMPIRMRPVDCRVWLIEAISCGAAESTGMPWATASSRRCAHEAALP